MPAAGSATPVTLGAPDGRSHRLRYRVWRAPTGIEVELEEASVPVGEGYQFVVLGDHDADVDELISRVRTLAEAEVGRQYLELPSHRDGWIAAVDEVAGRLVWNDAGVDGKPYNVVVDGRTLTWDELGVALEPFEGWHFRLTIEDPAADVRS